MTWKFCAAYVLSCPNFNFLLSFFFDPVLNFVCFLSYHSICIYLLHFLTIYVVEIHHKGLLSVILLNKLRYREKQLRIPTNKKPIKANSYIITVLQENSQANSYSINHGV